MFRGLFVKINFSWIWRVPMRSDSGGKKKSNLSKTPTPSHQILFTISPFTYEVWSKGLCHGKTRQCKKQYLWSSAWIQAMHTSLQCDLNEVHTLIALLHRDPGASFSPYHSLLYTVYQQWLSPIVNLTGFRPDPECSRQNSYGLWV